MSKVMVRYKVKADKSEENAEYIRNVFSELGESTPEGLRYASFRLEDGVSFVHLASIETADGSNPLGESAAFKAFQSAIRDRCEEPPVAMELEDIGAYRMFGD